jgi:NHL repeat-containing protein
MDVISMKHMSIYLLFSCIIAFPALNASSDEVLHTYPDAVLGQPDFYHNDPNYNANGPKEASAWGLNHPNGVAVYSIYKKDENYIAVADTNNSRIMIWKTSTFFRDNNWRSIANGPAARHVLGQPDFTAKKPNNPALSENSLHSPYDIAIIESRYVIADTGNNRIVSWIIDKNKSEYKYEKIIGQPDPSKYAEIKLHSIDSDELFRPKSVVLHFVSDFYNHRIINCGRFPSYPKLKDWHPDLIFGQEGYKNTREWNKGGVSASSLAFPRGMARDDKNLYVADFDNHRVLIYTTPKSSIDTIYRSEKMKADYVLGQDGDFTTRDGNKGGVSEKSLYFPTDVAVDISGNLYVADMGNHRVLKFNNPLKEDDEADFVFGQANDFTTREENKNGPGPESLSHPSGVNCDSNGNLFISDTHNNRVLIFYSSDSPGD